MNSIIPARILAEIETRTGRYIPSLFDIVGGTNTGAIIAASLVHENKKTKYPNVSANKLYTRLIHAYSECFI